MVEINFFHLKERYDYYYKVEASGLLDLKERYTDARILELARIMLGSTNIDKSSEALMIFAQIKQDIFSTQFMNTFHRAFCKLHNDIIK